MRILDAQVDWREEVANDPRLEVLVDEIPDRSELQFAHEDDIWCAIQDGFVEYYHWSGEGNDGGYSGRCFEITTVDGEQVTLRGPWSSRAGCVNQRRFGPVVDVRLTDDPETLARGYTFLSGTLTLSAAKQAIDLAEETCHLERQLKFDSEEPYWIPVRDGGEA
jgi:hypothetical protein